MRNHERRMKNKINSENCEKCNRITFYYIEGGHTFKFDDCQCMTPHTNFKCQVYQVYKKYFDKIEEDGQVKLDIQLIRCVMF